MKTEGNLSALLGSNYSRHLDLCNLQLRANDAHFLMSANASESVLPHLSSLVLSSSSFVGGSEALSALLEDPWRNIATVIFEDLLTDMCTVFVDALNRSRLPNLTELLIIVRQTEQVDVEIPNPEKLPRLESLTLSGLIKSKSQIKQLENNITKWKLKRLDLSHTSCLGGDSSALLSHSFPFLRSLILVDCALDPMDLKFLARAKFENRLPELKHLDISGNGIGSSLDALYIDPETQVEVTWPSVKCYDERFVNEPPPGGVLAEPMRESLHHLSSPVLKMKPCRRPIVTKSH